MPVFISTTTKNKTCKLQQNSPATHTLLCFSLQSNPLKALSRLTTSYSPPLFSYHSTLRILFPPLHPKLLLWKWPVTSMLPRAVISFQLSSFLKIPLPPLWNLHIPLLSPSPGFPPTRLAVPLSLLCRFLHGSSTCILVLSLGSVLGPLSSDPPSLSWVPHQNCIHHMPFICWWIPNLHLSLDHSRNLRLVHSNTYSTSPPGYPTGIHHPSHILIKTDWNLKGT